MNKLLSLTSLIVAVVALTNIGCDKSSTAPAREEDLIISTDAASYTIIPGPDFSFNLKIESLVPTAGVKIDYVVESEIDGQKYPQGPPINTSSKNTRITISSLPRQKICICTITVTSKNTIANTAKTGFRVGYK
jgi:hypothetical protein